jgi:acyl-CoA thioester hydrolase
MPQAPQPFEIEIAVAAGDIDVLGHVNNVTYVRWVQEAAAAHWRSAAPPEDQARTLWIVLRHEIDYKQPARLGDTVLARTWVGAASRVRFERFTELRRARDGAVLAAARTLWCPVDAQTLRPAAVSGQVRAAFAVE